MHASERAATREFQVSVQWCLCVHDCEPLWLQMRRRSNVMLTWMWCPSLLASNCGHCHLPAVTKFAA